MSGNPVKDNPKAVLVKHIYEILKIIFRQTITMPGKFGIKVLLHHIVT